MAKLTGSNCNIINTCSWPRKFHFLMIFMIIFASQGEGILIQGTFEFIDSRSRIFISDSIKKRPSYLHLSSARSKTKSLFLILIKIRFKIVSIGRWRFWETKIKIYLLFCKIVLMPKAQGSCPCRRCIRAIVKFITPLINKMFTLLFCAWGNDLLQKMNRAFQLQSYLWDFDISSRNSIQ